MTLYETTLSFSCIILKNEFSRIARNFDNNIESWVTDIKTYSIAREVKAVYVCERRDKAIVVQNLISQIS